MTVPKQPPSGSWAAPGSLFSHHRRRGPLRPRSPPLALPTSVSSPKSNRATSSADGTEEEFDSIILATGCTKSNMLSWLQDEGGLLTAEERRKSDSLGGWKGEKGLYWEGFPQRGLVGTSHGAVNITADLLLLLLLPPFDQNGASSSSSL